jgi:hypothetical protein
MDAQVLALTNVLRVILGPLGDPMGFVGVVLQVIANPELAAQRVMAAAMAVVVLPPVVVTFAPLLRPAISWAVELQPYAQLGAQPVTTQTVIPAVPDTTCRLETPV